jgi:hypothetical protein
LDRPFGGRLSIGESTIFGSRAQAVCQTIHVCANGNVPLAKKAGAELAADMAGIRDNLHASSVGTRCFHYLGGYICGYRSSRANTFLFRDNNLPQHPRFWAKIASSPSLA